MRQRHLPHLLSAFALTALAWLALSVKLAARNNGCYMTWMWPSFHEVDLASSAQPSTYRLFQYRELAADRLAHGVLDSQTGATVLFLPGHAGSYEQVRSLASETTRQLAVSDADPQAVAWYAVDFRNELAAFDGQLLALQTDFACACIRLLAARDAKAGRVKLFLVGHSMGGIVGQAAVTRLGADPSFEIEQVAGLMTLAAPHQRAPIAYQHSVTRFYDRLSEHSWPAVPMLGIAGGSLDTHVSAELARLPAYLLPGHCMAISSLDVPGMWVAAHHQAIVWCNQIVRKAASVLIELSAAHSAAGRVAVLQARLDSHAGQALMLFPQETPRFAVIGGQAGEPAGRHVPAPGRLLVLTNTQVAQARSSAWQWDLQPGNALQLVLSGVQPHQHFRIYASTGDQVQEVTSSAACLPPLLPEPRYIWHPSDGQPDTRDYMQQATWAVVLADQPGGSRRIVLELAAPGNSTAAVLMIAQVIHTNEAVASMHFGNGLVPFRTLQLPPCHAAVTRLDIPYLPALARLGCRLNLRALKPSGHVPGGCLKHSVLAVRAGELDLVRAAPAYLSLWMPELAGRQLVLVSDPRCTLALSWSTDWLAAGTSVLQRHLVSLPLLPAILALGALALPSHHMQHGWLLELLKRHQPRLVGLVIAVTILCHMYLGRPAWQEARLPSLSASPAPGLPALCLLAALGIGLVNVLRGSVALCAAGMRLVGSQWLCQFASNTMRQLGLLSRKSRAAALVVACSTLHGLLFHQATSHPGLTSLLAVSATLVALSAAQHCRLVYMPATRRHTTMRLCNKDADAHCSLPSGIDWDHVCNNLAWLGVVHMAVMVLRVPCWAARWQTPHRQLLHLEWTDNCLAMLPTVHSVATLYQVLYAVTIDKAWISPALTSLLCLRKQSSMLKGPGGLVRLTLGLGVGYSCMGVLWAQQHRLIQAFAAVTALTCVSSLSHVLAGASYKPD